MTQVIVPFVPSQPRLVLPEPALVEQLRADGWTPGAPDHLAAWARTIDMAIVRRAMCGSCACRGLAYRPMRRGRAYKVVGACGRCGHAEEF